MPDIPPYNRHNLLPRREEGSDISFAFSDQAHDSRGEKQPSCAQKLLGERGGPAVPVREWWDDNVHYYDCMLDSLGDPGSREADGDRWTIAEAWLGSTRTTNAINSALKYWCPGRLENRGSHL
jgi:hypothetical protein